MTNELRRRPLSLAAERADGGALRLAVSSDAIVPMPWGREQLLHGRDNIVYRKPKLPVFRDHDPGQVVGSADGFATDGHVLRARVHFASTELAQETRALVDEGHVEEASIGYRVLEWEPARDADGPYQRATKWELYELSIVPIGADVSVGVGRSAAGAAFNGDDGRMGTMADNESLRGAVGVNPEQVRVRGLGEVAAAYNMNDRLGKWVAEGVTVESATRQAADELLQRAERQARVQAPAGHLGMSEGEAKRYSFRRAILAAAKNDWSEAGLEREASLEIARRTGRETRGLFVPLDLPIQTRASLTGQVVGTSSLGGYSVQTTVMPLIELLRNKMVVKQAGATVLPGLRDNLSFPRQTTANAFNWVGENPSTGNALSSVVFDQVTMTPKTAMASSAFSYQSLVQAGMDQVVQNDLLRVGAIGLDRAALHGLGSANQPRGVFEQSGVNTVTFGSGQGAVPTFPQMVSFETLCAEDNALFEAAGSAFIVHPTIKGALKTTLKSTTAGSAYIWENDRIADYAAYASAQIRADYTTGTTAGTYGVVFGFWPELLIGEWGGAGEIIVDNVTAADQGMTKVHFILLADCAVRHPVSFAVATSAKAS